MSAQHDQSDLGAFVNQCLHHGPRGQEAGHSYLGIFVGPARQGFGDGQIRAPHPGILHGSPLGIMAWRVLCVHHGQITVAIRRRPEGELDRLQRKWRAVDADGNLPVDRGRLPSERYDDYWAAGPRGQHDVALRGDEPLRSAGPMAPDHEDAGVPGSLRQHLQARARFRHGSERQLVAVVVTDMRDRNAQAGIGELVRGFRQIARCHRVVRAVGGVRRRQHQLGSAPDRFQRGVVHDVQILGAAVDLDDHRPGPCPGTHVTLQFLCPQRLARGLLAVSAARHRSAGPRTAAVRTFGLFDAVLHSFTLSERTWFPFIAVRRTVGGMGGPADSQAGSWDEGTLEFAGLSRVRLDALLQELLGRVDEIMDSQERLRALLDAVVGIGADLDLNSTLDRIVTAACELVGARYGALGVVGPDGKRLVRFITHGVSAEEIAAIGPYPEGHGILGLLIDHPTPLRLRDLAEHPRSFGFPANHPPMSTFLGVPIRTRDHAFGNLYLTEKADEADFTEDDERTVTALAAAAGVVIDNARLYADTERRRRWHEVTAEITQLMLGDFDPKEALQLIANRAREVSGSLVGAVLLLDKDELVVEAIDGPPAFAQYVGRRMPADLPILADVLHSDEQAVVDDLAQLVKETGRLGDLPQAEDLGRTIVAPLPAGNRGSGGVLIVAAAHGTVLGVTAGTDLVRMFANQATLALDRAQAQRDQSVLAVLEDRDRIARDLHDLVIQRLFATGLQLQGMHRMVNPDVQGRIGQAVEDIDATIRDLRAAIFELHSQPGKPSLQSEVQTLVDEYTAPLGFRPELVFTGPIDSTVPTSVRPQIIAALRESLSNVVRHAQASKVKVEITVSGSDVTARISDDGIGISSSDRRSGLRNLEERAAALGGAVRLESNEPHGTVLELRAPLNAPPANQASISGT